MGLIEQELQVVKRPVPASGVMCCVMCHRVKEELIAGVVQETPVKGKHALLFVSMDNDVVCDRCVSERGLVLRYGGQPIVACDPTGTRIFRNSEVYARSNTAPLIDQTNLRDESRFKLEGKLGH